MVFLSALGHYGGMIGQIGSVLLFLVRIFSSGASENYTAPYERAMTGSFLDTYNGRRSFVSKLSVGSSSSPLHYSQVFVVTSQVCHL